jgi:uncharacterized protein (DUF58 family)
MWTKKGVMLVITGFGSILLSLVLKNYLFLNLGTIFLSYVVVNILLTRKGFVLDVERNIDKTRLFEDELIDVELRIKNTGFSISYLEVFDVIPKEFIVMSGSNHFFVALKNGEVKTIRYSVKCPRRGVYAFNEIKFRHYSHSFMLYYDRTLELYSTTVVLPEMSEIEDLRLKQSFPKLFQGAVTKRQIGMGNEFYSIRQYFPGDPFKKINWKAFGKTGKLMVNEYEREDINDVMLIVDARLKTALKNAVENPIDYESRAAASTAAFFMKRKDRVGLMIYGERISILQPENGERQLYNILNSLAAIRPEGDIPLKAVQELLVPTFTPHSPIVIFTPLYKDETIVDSIRELAAHGFEVIIISPNLPMFLGRVSPLDAKITAMHRNSLISELRYLGARVIDWRPVTPISSALASEGAIH